MFSFCKPVSSRKRFLPHRELNSGYSFTLFDSAASLPEEWNGLSGSMPFLEKKFLSVIEECVHTRLQCRYVTVYYKGTPCGIIYFQVVDFNAGLFGGMISRQVENIRTTRLSLFERYLDANRDEVLLRLFTCGNNLVSGEHGFSFDKKVPREKASELLLAITDVVAREEKLRGTIAAILLKDFYKPLSPAKFFDEENYSRFSVEPNMVVDIPENVHSLESYIGLFNKKYRNRARSVLRSMASLERRELSAGEMAAGDNEIYRLYLNVFEKAKFRLMQLPYGYFSRVKGIFGDTFFVKGYFLEKKLIAFSSFFLLPDGSLEAHYIGLDYEMNEKFELYQNILLDMISEAAKNGRGRVNLGRTAAEIKTTVGAKPRDLYCYIKPQNTVSRLVQRPFISFLQPAPWTARNPFREESATGEAVQRA